MPPPKARGVGDDERACVSEMVVSVRLLDKLLNGSRNAILEHKLLYAPVAIDQRRFNDG